MFRKVFTQLFGGKKSQSSEEEKIESNPNLIEVAENRQNEEVEEEEIPTGNHNLRLRLVQHKHTLFCERKSRVCSAVGKLQELEVIEIYGHRSSELISISWYRKSQDSSTVLVHANNNRDRYILDIADIECFIQCEIKWINNDTMAEETLKIPDILGPILPGPSRLFDLNVTGVLEVGKRAIASYKYVGGIEGCSEFWWLRINNGKREQISEPISISAINLSSSDYTDNDPRVYVIKEEDIGCILKVKCIPVRSDGYRGEIFTSKPSCVVGANVTVTENIEPRVNSKSIVKRLCKKTVTNKVSQRIVDTPVICDAESEAVIENDIKVILTSYGTGKVINQVGNKTVVQLPWGVLYSINSSNV